MLLLRENINDEIITAALIEFFIKFDYKLTRIIVMLYSNTFKMSYQSQHKSKIKIGLIDM